MRGPSSPLGRAAIGGSLVVAAVVVVVLALGGGSDDDDSGDQPKPSRARDTIIEDADVHGAVLTRGSVMEGVSAAGRVRWRLRVGDQYQAFSAVCAETCPRAEVGLGRDASPVPERPDGPRLLFGPPGWRSVQAHPRLRVDRPQLPGPAPVRAVMRRATGRASLVVPGGGALKIADPGVLAADLAADRRVGVVSGLPGGGGRALVLSRRGRGWGLTTSFSNSADSLCLSPDGSRIGLVGAGRPRVLEVRGRSRAPKAVPGARRGEDDAGACAIGRTTVATAVPKTGGRPTQVTVHAGRRVRTLSLPGSFDDMWVSERTGTTGVVVGTKIVLIDRSGRRKGTLPGVDAAIATGSDRLWVVPFRGRPYSRRF